MYGVALSHGSVDVLGEELVAHPSSDRDATSELAGRIADAQPGVRVALATLTDDGWVVDGLPVREWMSSVASLGHSRVGCDG